MEDRDIVRLYLMRDETAIEKTQAKYSGYVRAVAYNILCDEADTDEAENDVWLGVWNSIPPNAPSDLKGYLGKLARRRALDIFRRKNAQKRGGETALSLEELDSCVPSSQTAETEADARRLGELIDSFLRTLPKKQRLVFLRRYFYFDTLEEISRRYGLKEGNVKVMLMRTRNSLREYLAKEDIFV